MTPPTVSRPSDSGVTSSSSKSWTFFVTLPDKMAAWTAAPYATASSGLMDLHRLLAVEELGEQMLHLRDARGTADQDDFVDCALVDLGVLEHLLDGSMHLRNKSMFKLLEASAGDGGVEVDTLEEGVDLDGGARWRTRCAWRVRTRFVDDAERWRCRRCPSCACA